MAHFELVTVDGDAFGPVELARADWPLPLISAILSEGVIPVPGDAACNHPIDTWHIMEMTLPQQRTLGASFDSVEQLLRTTDILVRLADTALAEGKQALEGRVNGARTTIARKHLEINLIALRASGGPSLDAAWKLINEAPQFAAETAVGVSLALDEVATAIEASGLGNR